MNANRILTARYQQDGVVFPIPVLSADEVAKYRTALDSIATLCGAVGIKRFDSLHRFFPWAYQLATHTALLDVVENFLGPDIVIDGTLVFYKPPHDSSYASWHQDSVYSGWHLTPSISAWIALTSSNRNNGCMRVVPGSQKLGLMAHDNVQHDPNLLNQRGERLRMDVKESDAMDVVLRPGEMSLHHTNIVHGSNPNTSDGPRIGFIVRFVTNLTPVRDRLFMHVRGNADCSYLRLASPPVNENMEAAIAEWSSVAGVAVRG